jgi:hypothetical protein
MPLNGTRLPSIVNGLYFQFFTTVVTYSLDFSCCGPPRTFASVERPSTPTQIITKKVPTAWKLLTASGTSGNDRLTTLLLVFLVESRGGLVVSAWENNEEPNKKIRIKVETILKTPAPRICRRHREGQHRSLRPLRRRPRLR